MSTTSGGLTMPVEKFGEWNQVKALLQTNIRNALLLAREIKRGIGRQAPGGQQFASSSRRATISGGSTRSARAREEASGWRPLVTSDSKT